MISEVYDALLAAGAPEDKARAAAEAIAGYENRFRHIDKELADIKGALRFHNWMLTAVLGVGLMILFRVW